MEKTFSMIKPDGIQRGLVGEILQKFEKKGIKNLYKSLFSRDQLKPLLQLQ